MMSALRKQSRRFKQSGKGKQKKLRMGDAAWAHDQALLDEQFPDTQLWNFTSEHQPRFGKNNSKDNKVFNVVQTAVNRAVMTLGSIANSTFSRTFALNDLAQASSWTSVFDQYRIMQVEMWFRPEGTINTATATSIYTVIDYDDGNLLASENAAQQYENVTITSINEGVYRRFRPHIASVVYNSASVVNAFTNQPSQWIDSGYPAVPHYGFKALGTPGPSTVVFDFEYRYWVQFRNVF